MTLAIGMECEGGLILAADRRASYGDDSPTPEIDKLATFRSDVGTFAIAQSSTDANAANSLARNIQYAIQHQNPNRFGFVTLERLIELELRRWYVPVHDARPLVYLLIGMCLNDDLADPAHVLPPPLNRRLYFCEPPNTVMIVPDGYKAIGGAWTISDPIYNHWLRGFPTTPHSCLCCISYLMYKAKQLMPGAVGGGTDAVVITEKSSFFDYHIDRVSMATAEQVYGLMFDRSVSKFSSLVMAGDAGGMPTVMTIAENIYQISLNYSRAEFRCSMPPNTTITHQFCT